MIRKIVDEDGNIVEVEAIERVKPVLEVLEDEGSASKMTIQMMKRLMMNQTKTMLMMKHR
jgi:endonuclease V-like protein UPF0215 family